MGLIAAARISERLQISPAGLEATFREAVLALRLPTDLDTWVQGSTEQLVAALSRDKKREADAVTFIALRGVGQPTTVSLSPAEIVSLLRDQNPAR